MKHIASRLGHDDDLRAGTLSVLRAITVAQDVELPHRVHTQHFLAGSTGLHVVLGRAGKLHAVQQEKILLRAISRDREIIARGGIRNSDAAGLFPGEIHHPGIERQQFVITPPVQRKVAHLTLAHQPGSIRRAGADHRGIRVHGHLLAHFAHLQPQIDQRILSHH